MQVQKKAVESERPRTSDLLRELLHQLGVKHFLMLPEPVGRADFRAFLPTSR